MSFSRKALGVVVVVLLGEEVAGFFFPSDILKCDIVLGVPPHSR